MAQVNVLTEMGRLHQLHPAADASAAVVAGWYERKAQLFRHLATAGTAGAGELAEQAHQHAVQLLAVA